MVAMDFYFLVLGVLSVWRITHLLQAEDGPWNIVVRLRVAAGAGFFGAMLDCFACLSLWVAAPFAAFLGNGWGHGLLLWLSFSGGTMLLQRLAHPEADQPAAFYIEDEEK